VISAFQMSAFDHRWGVLYLVDFLEYFRLQFAGNTSANWSCWEELHNEDGRNRCIRTRKPCIYYYCYYYYYYYYYRTKSTL